VVEFTRHYQSISRHPIFHYGNYEVRAVDHLQKRHAVDCSSIKSRLISVTSFVFARIYFPVNSNSQKELGKYCGMTWTAPEASGLQSLVWRYRWERSRDERHKKHLLTYNQEDCAALSVLVDFLTNIGDAGSDRSRFQRAEKPAKDATRLGINIHNQFETILKSARADYNKNKLTVRRSRLAGTAEEEKVARNTGHQAYVQLVPMKFGKVVHLPSRRRCPQHKRELLLTSDQVVQKIVTDLVFTKSGCRKVITRYFGYKSYCWRT
jgi:RNase_H superfamily